MRRGLWGRPSTRSTTGSPGIPALGVDACELVPAQQFLEPTLEGATGCHGQSDDGRPGKCRRGRCRAAARAVVGPSMAVKGAPHDGLLARGRVGAVRGSHLRSRHTVVVEPPLRHEGVLVLTGGPEPQRASVVVADGTITEGPYPDAAGGMTIVAVPSREAALAWAAEIADACRCGQEVRGFMPDAELDAMLRRLGRRERRPDGA